MVTEGQDTPATNPNTTPILLLDLWEHSYYLDVRKRSTMASVYRFLSEQSFRRQIGDAHVVYTVFYSEHFFFQGKTASSVEKRWKNT